MQQLILPLINPSNYSRSAWVVGDCNAEALGWVDAWPNWRQGTRFLCLYGAAGAGKTHLAHIWADRAKALFADASLMDLPSPYDLIGDGRAIVLDEVEPFAGLHPEWLFHFYNCAKEKNSYVLMIGNNPPTQWQTDLPDLKSRLSTFSSVEVGQPDEVLLAAVFQKQLDERGLRASDGTIEYLLKRIDRSFESLNFCVRKLDRYAAITRRTITTPLVKELLEADRAA